MSDTVIVLQDVSLPLPENPDARPKSKRLAEFLSNHLEICSNSGKLH